LREADKFPITFYERDLGRNGDWLLIDEVTQLQDEKQIASLNGVIIKFTARLSIANEYYTRKDIYLDDCTIDYKGFVRLGGSLVHSLNVGLYTSPDYATAGDSLKLEAAALSDFSKDYMAVGQLKPSEGKELLMTFYNKILRLDLRCHKVTDDLWLFKHRNFGIGLTKYESGTLNSDYDQYIPFIGFNYYTDEKTLFKGSLITPRLKDTKANVETASTEPQSKTFGYCTCGDGQTYKFQDPASDFLRKECINGLISLVWHSETEPAGHSFQINCGQIPEFNWGGRNPKFGFLLIGRLNRYGEMNMTVHHYSYPNPEKGDRFEQFLVHQDYYKRNWNIIDNRSLHADGSIKPTIYQKETFGPMIGYNDDSVNERYNAWMALSIGQSWLSYAHPNEEVPVDMTDFYTGSGETGLSSYGNLPEPYINETLESYIEDPSMK
jgi:hypothetical protein